MIVKKSAGAGPIGRTGRPRSAEEEIKSPGSAVPGRIGSGSVQEEGTPFSEGKQPKRKSPWFSGENQGLWVGNYEPNARKRKVTIWARLQGSWGLKLLSELPSVMPCS